MSGRRQARADGRAAGRRGQVCVQPAGLRERQPRGGVHARHGAVPRRHGRSRVLLLPGSAERRPGVAAARLHHQRQAQRDLQDLRAEGRRGRGAPLRHDGGGAVVRGAAGRVGGDSGPAGPADAGVQRRGVHRGLLHAVHAEDDGESLQLRGILRRHAGADDAEPHGDLHPVQLHAQVVRELPEEDDTEPELLEKLSNPSTRLKPEHLDLRGAAASDLLESSGFYCKEPETKLLLTHLTSRVASFF